MGRTRFAWPVLLSIAGACGGKGTEIVDAGPPGFNPACAADRAEVVAPAVLPNAGAVILVSRDGTHSVTAGFPATGQYPTGLGNGTRCACSHGGVTIINPCSTDAGTIKVMAPNCGATLATLGPASGGLPGCIIYETTRVKPWVAGQALSVLGQAGGADIFGGSLQTGGLMADVMPAIGPTTMTPAVSLSKDFALTWTPEGMSGEAVTLTINQLGTGGTCSCSTDDANGKLTIPSSSLKRAFAPSTSKDMAGDVSLTRSIVRTYVAGKSSVDLVSQVQTLGTFDFQRAGSGPPAKGSWSITVGGDLLITW